MILHQFCYQPKLTLFLAAIGSINMVVFCLFKSMQSSRMQMEKNTFCLLIFDIKEFITLFYVWRVKRIVKICYNLIKQHETMLQ